MVDWHFCVNQACFLLKSLRKLSSFFSFSEAFFIMQQNIEQTPASIFFIQSLFIHDAIQIIDFKMCFAFARRFKCRELLSCFILQREIWQQQQLFCISRLEIRVHTTNQHFFQSSRHPATVLSMRTTIRAN